MVGGFMQLGTRTFRTRADTDRAADLFLANRECYECVMGFMGLLQFLSKG